MRRRHFPVSPVLISFPFSFSCDVTLAEKYIHLQLVSCRLQAAQPAFLNCGRPLICLLRFSSQALPARPCHDHRRHNRVVSARRGMFFSFSFSNGLLIFSHHQGRLLPDNWCLLPSCQSLSALVTCPQRAICLVLTSHLLFSLDG